LTVKVKIWNAEPALLVASMMNSEVPLAVGVPEMVAVPFELAVKLSPFGRLPMRFNVAAGLPVVVTVKLKTLPTVAVADAELAKAGALLTPRVNVCVTVPEALEAVRVTV
jgi:hypothetical protein